MQGVVSCATAKFVFYRLLNPRKSTGVMCPRGLLPGGARTKGRASGGQKYLEREVHISK